MTRSNSTASTEATHNEARSTRGLGYVGYCHLGTARVWSESLKDCQTQAQEFIAANEKYLTRKGLFIYQLADEKKYIKRIHNVDNM